jgi:signal-transduction protein with cAMP-binding, CBS, and nucleotidyltransferase domain
MKEPISTLMTQRVWSVDMDDTVAQVEELFTRNALSWAPVLEAGRLILGVISATDLLQFHAQGGEQSRVRAWQLCTYKPISADHATPLDEVARAMVAQRIHHVVVMRGGEIAGVVSSLDFVRAFAEGR